MAPWLGYLHFLLSQLSIRSIYSSNFNKPPISAFSSKLLKDEAFHRKSTRVELNQPTAKVEERGEESGSVWGFEDTEYRADEDGVVVVTGSRYFLSGHKLPSLLPWARETLGVEVPAKPTVELNHQAPLIPEPRFTEGRFFEAIRQFLHDEQISQQPDVLRRHGHGHTQEEIFLINYGAGLERLPDVVVYPDSELQVVQIVEAAQRHDVCLIPYGGGSNVTEALRCPHGQGSERVIASLDMRRLDKIVWMDPFNRLARIEAGAVGTNIMAALAKHGFTIGHEPDSCEFSTLGGWIATNASGMKKNRYGNIEDIVLDMRVVTASGEILTKGSCDESRCSVNPRQSAGSDPMRYLFGSEGTLGIVVSAVVKIFPLPEVQDYAAVMFPFWENGVQFMYDLQQANGRPASVRLVDNEQFRMSMALKPARPTGLVGIFAGLKSRIEQFYMLQFKGFEPHRMVACTIVFEGSSSEVRSQQAIVNTLVRRHHGVHAGAENGKRGYQMTYNIAYIRDFAMKHYILGESFETSVPWSMVLQLCQSVKDRVRREHKERSLPGKPLITCRVTQVYETGVAVYFYLAYYFEGVAHPERVFAEIEEAARDEILKCEGSLSHHHGVGKLRNKFLGRVWSDAALTWRREVKKALDPEDIFGCGNLVAV